MDEKPVAWEFDPKDGYVFFRPDPLTRYVVAELQSGDEKYGHLIVDAVNEKHGRELGTASPEPVQDRELIEAECARLLAAYLRKEIGRLMHQAEHWAENDKPLAVHHRVMKADDYFQILVLMERDPANGCKLPFDEIRAALERPDMNAPGKYPPSADLYRYRDPVFVAAALSAAEPAIRGDEVA